MGTLTANQSRLPEHCDHKLPTSCRLSSIPQCCACADERAHAASYSTYIDGIGYVPRGNRWQRYCWFCKEFWQARVDASGLRPGQTRIPEIPDQTEFLRRWYEFHQGYRVITRQDGNEERVAVIGEDFRDVAPGYLPRTLDEIRAGRIESELAEQEARQRELMSQDARTTEPTGPSLEDALDQLFQDAESEQTGERRSNVVTESTHTSVPDNAVGNGSNVHAQSMNPAGTRNLEYQARRIAALRRELHRMRNGIERVVSGLRYLGETVPDHTEATSRLVELGRTLENVSGIPTAADAQRAIESVNSLTETVTSGTSQGDRTLANIQARVDQARQVANEARRNRDQAASELDHAEQELRSSQTRLRQLQTEQRTTENYIRLFGTREEMMEQGESYESPIGGMFTRAWERFRIAEEVRREEQTLRQALADEARVESPDIFEDARHHNSFGTPVRDAPGRIWPAVDESQPAQRDAETRSENGAEALEEPHDLLLVRRQDGSLIRTPGSGLDNTLDNHRPRSEDGTDATINRQRHASDIAANVPSAPPMAHVRSPGPRGQLGMNPQENRDRGLDAVHVLRAIARNDSLQTRERVLLDSTQTRHLLRSVETDELTVDECNTIQNLLENPNIVWETGLPAERNHRRRQRGEEVSFTPDALEMASGGLVTIHDVEVMAECFQRSGQLRSQSGLTGIEALSMCYRLQHGERTARDRDVLFRMIQNESALNLAKELQEQFANEPTQGQLDRQAAVERDRQDSARQGDHSRDELDAQRRATHAFALAAGRTAMRAGPTALLQQLASRDDETRAVYQRLQDNGYVSTADLRDRIMQYRPLSLDDFTAAPSASDSEHEDSDAEARGLDAPDSGRPEEPMTDEDMTLKLDCRICYAQVADVACLPCGHLVMCRWCSEQHSPVMAHDRTRPRRPAGCPVCRKNIRQKVRVFRA